MHIKHHHNAISCVSHLPIYLQLHPRIYVCLNSVFFFVHLQDLHYVTLYIYNTPNTPLSVSTVRYYPVRQCPPLPNRSVIVQSCNFSRPLTTLGCRFLIFWQV